MTAAVWKVLTHTSSSLTSSRRGGGDSYGHGNESVIYANCPSELTNKIDHSNRADSQLLSLRRHRAEVLSIDGSNPGIPQQLRRQGPLVLPSYILIPGSDKGPFARGGLSHELAEAWFLRTSFRGSGLTGTKKEKNHRTVAWCAKVPSRYQEEAMTKEKGWKPENKKRLQLLL
jgi:hypothetical protein